MQVNTLTAKKKDGSESLVVHTREHAKGIINLLLAFTPQKTEFILEFPTRTSSPEHTAREFEKFAQKRWGAAKTELGKETLAILHPKEATETDQLIIVLRQSGIDPEDKGITREKLVWFRVKNVEHFSDRMEFYSEALGDHGQVDIVGKHNEDYSVGSAGYRKKNKLAARYAFLQIRPASCDSFYPESLRVEPPV